MKVQVDITVNDRETAGWAVDSVANAIHAGVTADDVYVGGRVVGRFEILEAQEQAA